MESKITSKRTYDSSRRKEAARQTRRQILDAARRLFIELGYSGATMEAIALQAGVAVETVYAVFKNKRSILSELMSFSLTGDDDPTPFLKRAGPQKVVHESDQHLQTRGFSEGIAEIMGRAAPLFEVMRTAAKLEPDIAIMMHSLLAERAEGMKFFVKAVLENGPLRDGMTLDLAAETVWALTSGEVYTLLVTERGWSVEKYVGWLANALARILLP